MLKDYASSCLFAPIYECDVLLVVAILFFFFFITEVVPALWAGLIPMAQPKPGKSPVAPMLVVDILVTILLLIRYSRSAQSIWKLIIILYKRRMPLESSPLITSNWKTGLHTCLANHFEGNILNN